MPSPRFRDDRWERIYGILLSFPGLYIRQAAATRRFVENVFWVARAVCAWRLLPERYGAWNSVYKRFARWQERGVWLALLRDLSGDADLEGLMLDSTVMRAHACYSDETSTEPRAETQSCSACSSIAGVPHGANSTALRCLNRHLPT